jgi:hypothetical protein
VIVVVAAPLFIWILVAAVLVVILVRLLTRL